MRPLNGSGESVRLSAVCLAHLIRTRATSARDIIDQHISRIQAVNPRINALVAERFDAARVEADAADALIAAGGPLPPLLGVPFTSKEMLWVKGMPSTIGAIARRDRLALSDATVIARLRAAGAIPLGVTNEPEWGMWVESYNRIYGRTNNPYDASRIPGGSSGGEGAMVGAGCVPFGIGSDIGGSVRIPAAMCGVFGHKPTTGMLPLTGHYPVFAEGPDTGLHRVQPILTLGVLARRAEDLAPLLRIMAGPDDTDPNAVLMEVRDPSQVDWSGRRVLVIREPEITFAAGASDEMSQAVQKAAHVLASRGAAVQAAPSHLFRSAVALWLAALDAGGERFRSVIGGGSKVSVGSELLRALVRKSEFTWPVLIFAGADRLTELVSPARIARLRAEADRLASDFNEMVGDGVLLMPPHPRTAPRHNAPLLRPLDFAYTAALNVLRVPATVAPMGLGEGGLPLSVQIAAQRGNDHVTIAAAVAIEEQLGGWIPPRRMS